MVSDRSPSSTIETSNARRGSSTAVNALIGAAVGIILSFVPLSTLLGGAVAGYLEGGEPRDGMTVGAFAGGIMLIPIVLLGTFALLFFLGFGTGGSVVAFGFMAVFVLAIGAVYSVGLSAVGGYLGVYVRHEL